MTEIKPKNYKFYSKITNLTIKSEINNAENLYIGWEGEEANAI